MSALPEHYNPSTGYLIAKGSAGPNGKSLIYGTVLPVRRQSMLPQIGAACTPPPPYPSREQGRGRVGAVLVCRPREIDVMIQFFMNVDVE